MDDFIFIPCFYLSVYVSLPFGVNDGLNFNIIFSSIMLFSIHIYLVVYHDQIFEL